MRDFMKVRLRDIASRVTVRNNVGNTNVLTISAAHGLVSQEKYFNRRVASADLSQYYLLREGDFAYNKSYSDGWPAGVVQRLERYAAGVVSPLYICFRPNHELVDPSYLQHYFNSGVLNDDILWIAKEGVRNHGLLNVKVEDFFDLSLTMLPLAEQRRIAEILDEFDAQIDSARAAADKEAKALRAVLLSRLSDPRHLRCTVRSLLSERLRNGYSPTEAEGWTGYLVLGLGCLTPQGFEARQLKPVSPEAVIGSRAFLADGDLLVSRANTRELVGLVGIYRDVGTPCIYPDLMMRLRPREGISAEFLESALGLPESRRRIQSLSQGTSESMVKITGDVICNLEVPLPSPEERDELLRIGNAARARLELHAESVAKLVHQKQALMGDLLTGKVRVPANSLT